MFPVMRQGEASDVVVQPYNSVLTLSRLIEQPNAVVVLDNTALHRIAGENVAVNMAAFDLINSMVSFINTDFPYLRQCKNANEIW